MRDSPPPRRTTGRPGKYDWTEITDRLKKAPGKWFLVDAEARRGLDTAIRNKKMAALKQDGWKFHVSIRDTNRIAGTAAVWMSAEREE